MTNSDPSPTRSLDVAGTKTVNAVAYDDPNARLRLNRQGLPVAIRRVPSVGRPGSFATRRYQVITPRRVVGMSYNSLRRWENLYAQPVN